MNITRRGLLFGVGALAATAVVPRELVPLPESDMQRLMRLARTQRIIQDQTFLLDGPIRLDGISDLLVQRCQFIWTKPAAESPIFRIERASNIRIFYCSFDSRGQPDPLPYAPYLENLRSWNATLKTPS